MIIQGEKQWIGTVFKEIGNRPKARSKKSGESSLMMTLR
jgi:hypothetical protein